MLTDNHKAIVESLRLKRLKESKDKNQWVLKREEERKKKAMREYQQGYHKKVRSKVVKEKLCKVKIRNKRAYFDRFKITRIQTIKRKKLVIYTIQFMHKPEKEYRRINIPKLGYRMVRKRVKWNVAYFYGENRFVVSESIQNFSKRFKKAWFVIKPWIEIGLI